MEGAKPGRGLGLALEDSMAKRLMFGSAQRAEPRGRCIEPGEMCDQVALQGPHLMVAASRELFKPHERMRAEREGKGVIGEDRGEGVPVFDHE